MAFENGALPNVNGTFTINGVPFSGAGFGYASTGGSAGTSQHTSAFTIAGSNPPIALLPGYPVAAYTATNSNPPGGANSDYTAADFQHMLWPPKCRRRRNRAWAALMTPIPSLHRPELIQVLDDNQYGNLTAEQYVGVGDTGWHEPMRTITRIYANDHAAAHGQFNSLASGGKSRPSEFHGQQPELQSDLGRRYPPAGYRHRPMGRGQRRRRGCRTACGSIWGCRSARRPTAGSISRCSPSSASTSTAG